MKGNKGEWSEPYVLIKLLVDGELRQGEMDMSASTEEAYRVVGVSRSEKIGQEIVSKIYERGASDVAISCNGSLVTSIPLTSFSEYVTSLFEEISNMSGSISLSGHIASFFEKIKIESVKADSKKKADIDVIIHDHYTATNQKLGFSVKSQLGSPSTLVNASVDNTNFRYRINGDLSATQVAEINAISTRRKVKDRLEFIGRIGGELEFDRALGDVYNDNLLLIDRDLASILSRCLLIHFSGLSSSLRDISNHLDVGNHLDYPSRDCGSFYEFKLKRYLSESALGMMPATEWSGKHHATGGYIIVKNDGELVSYHLLRKNMFEDYLLHNTKFETPSTTRHEFGQIYSLEDGHYINLNLQIRFKK